MTVEDDRTVTVDNGPLPPLAPRIPVIQVGKTVHTVSNYGARMLDLILKMMIGNEEHVDLLLFETVQTIRVPTPNLIQEKIE